MAAKPLLHYSPARRSALLLLTRCIASALPPDVDLEVDLSHPVFSIWGSNTGVGKTLVSAGIASSVLSTSSIFSYIKPVQTGFPLDSDSRFVYRKVSEVFARRHPELTLIASNRVLKASRPASEGMIGPPNVEDGSGAVAEGFRELCWYEERRVVGAGVEFDAPGLSCKTMFAWKEAISPHLAAEREGAMVDDSSLRGLLQECLIASQRSKDVWTLIETAGGVASPGPSGSLQCDLYRYMALMLCSYLLQKV